MAHAHTSKTICSTRALSTVGVQPEANAGLFPHNYTPYRPSPSQHRGPKNQRLTPRCLLGLGWLYLSLCCAACGLGTPTENVEFTAEPSPIPDEPQPNPLEPETPSPEMPIEGCGNGQIEGEEACDDNNQTDEDGCSAQCTREPGYDCVGTPSVCTTTCGDGIQTNNERCDDGNRQNNDGCDQGCTVEPGYVCEGAPSRCITVCGDGVTTPDEMCDDNNLEEGDGCDATCQVEVGFFCTAAQPSICTSTCNDGIIASDEMCDDNNIEEGDGCNNACQVEQGFVCQNEPSECNSTCGDNTTASDESCDDGNLELDDGCDANCQVEAGFTCEGSPSQCNSVCGDGALRIQEEECDDGRNNSDTIPNACRTSCKNAYCGDGVIDDNEECDDGVNNSDILPDACRTNCQNAHCGDGVIDREEMCEFDPNTPCACNAQCMERTGSTLMQPPNTIITTTTALEDLSTYTIIEGDLVFESLPNVRTLVLSNLTCISGALQIDGTNVDTIQLPNLDVIGTDFHITNHSQLQEVALPVLTTIGGGLRLVNNAALNNLSTLPLQRPLGNNLALQNLPAMASLSWLSNLQSVQGQLSLENLPALASLEGLQNLTHIQRELRLLGTPVQDVEPLAQLTHLGGLIVRSNPQLTSLSFPNQQHTDLANLDLLDNLLLAQLHIPGVEVIQSAFRISNSSLSELSFPDLQAIHSNIQIIANNNLTSIAAFSNLTELERGLNLQNAPMLQDLSPLSNVQGTIEGSLVLVNTRVRELLPFSNITSINGDLQLSALQITSLEGFENLTELRGNLTLENNFQLDEINDLQGLTSLSSSLRISNNTSLSNLRGLRNITGVLPGSLQLINNNRITSLEPLNNLTSLSELEITGSALSDLAGLENLTLIENTITLRGNLTLTDLSSLFNLENPPATTLEITQNNSLAQCHIEEFLREINDGATVSTSEIMIENNANNTCE